MTEFASAGFTVPKHLQAKVAGNAKPDGVAVMMPDSSALEVLRLTKRFDRLAVDSLDLTIHAGEFYALVGPNGAGKTTTLRMVAGLLRPDMGSVSVFGIDALKDPIAAKQVMAWGSGEPNVQGSRTPRECAGL